MYFDEPQVRGLPIALPQMTPTFGQTVEAGVEESFMHTSIGHVMGIAQGMKANGDSQPLSEDEYKNSMYYREGGYQPGMTVGQARAKATQIDEQTRQAILAQGPTSAGVLGQLAGGAMDPLLYIPFIDEFAPAVRTAEVASRGEVVGNAVAEAANFGAVTAAEQPLAYADAKANGQEFDWKAAAQSVGYATLGGGFFGGLGAKLGLGIEQKSAGIAKVLDDAGKDPMAAADVAGVVKPKPGAGDYTPAAPLPPEAESPNLEGFPLTDHHQALLADAEEEATRLTGISRALRAGAHCYANS